MSMTSYAKHTVILVRYPFSNLSNTKIRPAVIVGVQPPFQDLLITPLTSKTQPLLLGEFILNDWAFAGLNVTTAVKRGIYTIHKSLVIKIVGQLIEADQQQIKKSLKLWLEL